MQALIGHYKFNIMSNKEHCDGEWQFPGPRIIAREGDRLVIKVVNNVQYNVTIHWAWSETTKKWMGRWTCLYYTMPNSDRKGVAYPCPQSFKEVPVLFGEWWKADTEKLISQAVLTGGAPNISDAYTINGLPGLLYNCSAKGVKPRKTYLLRLVNAALNDELFFSIANHNLTVVEVDAVYVKPFKTDTILITPGQTSNVLLKTKHFHPNASFLMSARPYATGPASFDNSTTTGILKYHQPSNNTNKSNKFPLLKPKLPIFNDTTFGTSFVKIIRSLANAKFPANVPKKVDKHFFFTVGLGLNPCP
ncbi:hypothetical protein P3S67_000776 [Capsicum chacoense]